MPSEENYTVAVLIDAENVDPAYADQIFSYAHSLGLVTVREIYGSGTSLNEWADPILVNSIHTNFTLRPNRFKNSSDICLVIGAMEILAASRSGNANTRVAAMVIASSDSDFSPLAVHLRASGIDVIGMGEPGHINPMWPRACTDFIPLEANGPMVRKRDPEPSAAASSAPPHAAAPVASPASQKPENAQDAPEGKQPDSISSAEKKAPAPKSGKAQSAPAGQSAEKNTKAASRKSAKSHAGDAPKAMPAEAVEGIRKSASAAPPNPPKAPAGEAPTAAPAEAAEAKQKSKPRVSPNHKARMEVIRSFMTEKISASGGRIKSGELFRSLASLPDYKYDQQRSRRNPLDYLEKQYGEWFSFTPGGNGSRWIAVRALPESQAASEASASDRRPSSEAAPAADNAPAVPESASADAVPAVPESTSADAVSAVSESISADAVPAVSESTSADEVPAVSESTSADAVPAVPESTAEEPAPVEPSSESIPPTESPSGSDQAAAPEASAGRVAEPAPDPDAVQRLIASGIPAHHAPEVADILSGCRHLRDSYNHLRQAYGNETGKKYQEIIRQAGLPLGRKAAGRS